MAHTLVLTDDPAPFVRRVTLNRPEKRNALNATLRREILAALREADADPDVRVTIVRGNGPSFCAGYDLMAGGEEYGVDATEGSFQRSVVDGWISIWDLRKPVIAQIHGHCLAGGSELATGCDLVYAADDAKIGYPAVRFGTPDMQYHAWLVGMRKGMEMMLTGDTLSGVEAAHYGFATGSFPADELEARVLEKAQRVAKIPADVLQINKRTVHRAMDRMGFRDAIRAGTELSAVAVHTDGFKAFIDSAHEQGLTQALTARDGAFGDGRLLTNGAD